MTQENKDDKEEKVSKAELEKVLADNQKLKEDLEDLRLETITPEYMEFLELKTKGAKKEEKKEQPKQDLSKLTPEEIHAKALKDASDLIEAKLKEKDELAKKDIDARKEKAVADFAKEHDDFEKFRPIMYGMALDHPDWDLPKLYNESKKHVNKLAGVTEDDKNRGRRASSEKPRGQGGASFDPNKKYTPMDAAKEAWSEVIGGELTFEE